MTFQETTNEDNQRIEASDATSTEILELKKKLAEDIVDKLSKSSSDSMSSLKQGAIKNYLLNEESSTDIIDRIIIGGLGGLFGLLPSNIDKYREMLAEADTKDKLETLRKNIFDEIGGAEQALTTTQKSNILPENSDGIIGKACQVAVDIANDNSYGYELGGTGNKNGRKGFDCQSFVRHCYRESGINVPPSGGCGTMKRDFEKVGFECITFNKDEKLKPGDILLDPKKHTEMCVGENKIAGAHSNKDKKAGDSGGEEISVRSVKSSLSYRNPKYILRYKGNLA